MRVPSKFLAPKLNKSFMSAQEEKIWRNYDQAGLDSQYNSRATVPDFTVYIRQYAERTRAAKASLPCIENLRYGDASAELLDIYPASHANAPVLVFLHGGDWRTLSKEDGGFGAPAFVAEGITFVVPDFTLVPNTTVQAMGEQLSRMLVWVWRNISAHGGDPSRVFLAGHSSGANLVTQLLTTDQMRTAGAPADLVKGAVFISGLGDLEPVRLSFRNDNLRLDRAAVLRASLLHRQPTVSSPLLVAVGERETDDYKRQAREVVTYWNAKGNQAEYFELAGHHHFNSVLAWADPQSAFFRATLAMMDRT